MKSQSTATKSSPCSPQLEKAHAQQRRPNAAKNKLIYLKKKKVEVTQVSTDGPINKMWPIHTMEYYSVLKRKEILAYATM